MAKRFAKFLRSGALDVLAWACVAMLFAIWLYQVSARPVSDTGHARFIGLVETVE